MNPVVRKQGAHCRFNEGFKVCLWVHAGFEELIKSVLIEFGERVQVLRGFNWICITNGKVLNTHFETFHYEFFIAINNAALLRQIVSGGDIAQNITNIVLNTALKEHVINIRSPEERESARFWEGN